MKRTEPIKLGIVGIGRAGWAMHCPELRERMARFRIFAACDVRKDRRDLMEKTFECRTYSRIEDMVRDREVEVVAIATRSCDHFAHAALALKAGKDVFVEKPMCRTYVEAQKLRALASKARGRLFVRHNRFFEPAFQHILEILDSGVLGEVYQVKLCRVGYSRRDDWQTLKEFGGGQLLNWGPHVVQHALRFLGAPVQEIWSNLRRVTAVGDAEDHVKLVLTGRNGRVVDLEISGGAAIGQPEFLVWASRGAISCAGSTLTVKYLNPFRKLKPRRPDPGTPDIGSFGTPEKLDWIEKSIPVAPANGSNMGTIWDELYLSVRDWKPFPVSVDEAVEVLRIIDEAKKNTPFR